MRKFSLIVTLLVLLTGCRGWFTQHDYTEQEISDIANYLNVSNQRAVKYLQGDISLKELNTSKARLIHALAYIQKIKENKRNKNDAD